jgi:SLA1 homology domain 1, SHD1
MKNLLALLLAAMLCGSALAQSRVWTSTNGKTVEAELVGQSATHVQLKRLLDGVVLDVPITSLSAEDVAILAPAKPLPAAGPSPLDDVVAPSIYAWRELWYRIAPAGTKPGVPPMQAMFDSLAAGDGVITRRELLAGYAADDRLGRFCLGWIKVSSLGAALIGALDAEVVEMTRAGDPQMPIVRRASEKLTLQFNENGVRQDAQVAVAAALKVLAQKK